MRAWKSLNDLIRPPQQRLRNRQPERLGGLEVDDQLELGWLLDGEIGGSRALQDLVDIDGTASVEIGRIRGVAHQAATSMGPVCPNIVGSRCRMASLVSCCRSAKTNADESTRSACACFRVMDANAPSSSAPVP